MSAKRPDRQFVCRPCRVANTVVYPVDDPELCPHLPEYELCPHCGDRMGEVPPGPVEPWPELIALREQHAKPPHVVGPPPPLEPPVTKSDV